MQELLRAFFDIALWRRGPEDLPSSGFLLSMALAAYVLATVATISFYSQDESELVRKVMLDLILTFGFFGILLMLNRKTQRLTQTLTALFGTGVLLTLISLPLVAWFQAQSGDAQFPPALLLFVVALWSIAITGHILRASLEIPLFGGLVLGGAYFLLNLAAFAEFFPAEIQG